MEPAPPSDLLATADLLARIRGGERGAADDLFRRYRPRLLAFVHSRVPPSARATADTQDVVQEVCVKILRSLDRLHDRGIGSFWGFARTLAKNHLVDLARRGGARREGKLASDSGAAPADPADGPLRALCGGEAAAAFDRALEGLPPRVRDGVVMRLELGLDWDSVAREGGFPSADAARVAVKRALAFVAKEMARHGARG